MNKREFKKSQDHNKHFIDILERRLGEYDYLFQEGVIFSDDEVIRIEKLMKEIQYINGDVKNDNEIIRNNPDIFLNS